jgi:WD40 repeat protein/DNA-binding CsgD family transcriptional regulator
MGVVLYEMLTGEHPFPGVDKITYIYKHLNDPLPAVETLEDNIRNDVNDVIQKATAKDPKLRFENVIEMMEALRKAAQLDLAPTPTSLVELLTPREQEVMQLIIDGKSNREIADILTLAEGTVKQYISSIYRKLKVRSRVQAIARARDLDFVVKKPESLQASGRLPELDNPYKGLRSFQSADAQNFFGREKLTQKLLDRLQENVEYQRFLAVVGPSGSGKSSVVKAGLIPALWHGDLPGSENWYGIDLLPGAHPIDELEVLLFQIATDKGMNIREQLERDDRGLIRVANMLLPDEGSELLVIIDQFEELFTLVENETERLHFLKLLRAAVTDKRSKVRVVVTLRADYYDRPLQYAEFGDLMRDRVETVLPLSAEELERAVTEPANRQGITFEDGLVSRIVSDVHYQPGSLPLLQYALTELFERRDGRTLTQAAYQEIGGTGGALANRADEIYLEQNDDGREMIRQLFLRLVTLGEGAEDTRRRVQRTELLAITPDPEIMDELIDLYAVSRLFSLDNDPSTRRPIVEVAHEAILREWERLRNWLNESREDIRQQRIVARAAIEWSAHGQDISYLLTGSRLEQLEEWYEVTALNLTPGEQMFITASMDERDQRRLADEQREARESRLEQRAYNRLRALVGVFAGAALIAIILLVFLFNAFNNVEAERINAQRIGLSAQGQIILQNGQPAELAALLAANSLELDYSSEADAVLLTSLQRGFARREYVGHSDAVRNVYVTSDGLRVISFSEDHTARIWDINTGEELLQFDHGSLVTGGWISTDGRYLATSGADGNVLIWNATDGTRIQTLSHGSGFVWVSRFSPDNRYIMSSDNSDTVKMWNIETGEVVRTFESSGSQFGYTMFSADGDYALGIGSDVVLWDVETGEVVRRFFGHTEFVLHADISPDGRRLITGGLDTTARVWDIATGQEIRRFDDHTQTIGGVNFSPNGRYALTASDDGTVRVWYLATGEELQRLELPGLVYTAKYLPDGNHIVTGGSDRTLRLWRLDTPGEPLIFAEEFNSSKRGELNLGAELLASDILLTSGANGGLRFWQREDDGYVIDNEMVYGDQVVDVLVYHQATAQVVTASNEGVVQLWDADGGELKVQFVGHQGTVLDIGFASDGERVVTAGSDATARVWNTITGKQLFELTGHNGSVQAARFSPDGSIIATAGNDFTAILWDANTGKQLTQLNGHSAAIRDIDFSPDGRHLVTVSNDTTALLWDVDSGEIVRHYNGHTDQIWSVSFSPDGRYILTGSADLTARLWDVETGDVVRQLVGHQNSVQSVGLSPDGSRIITGDDQAAYLWHTNLTELVDFACSLIPRDLTSAERDRYGLKGEEPVCDSQIVSNQNIEATWTPHPPLPTPDSLVLAPIGENSEFEFDFAPIPVVFIDVMHVPAPDVHIQTDDGMVMRAETLDEETLNLPLYATTEDIPMDFIVAPFDAGPYEQGIALGFTLAEWLTATGHGTYSVGAGGATLRMEFENLLPNALYTTWCVRVNLPAVNITDVPCGDIDGSNNSFVSDEAGSAVVTIELNEALLPSTEDIRTGISIAYHSDGRTYGQRVGNLGMNAHQQLIYEFPFE